MKNIFYGICIVLLTSVQLYANEAKDDSNLKLSSEQLKARIIELNRDLFLLEEDLLHPVSTRVALYLSLDHGKLFQLESVKLKLDGSSVSSFLYTQKDLEALKRGAIQPLFQTNIASGEHELVAVFTGIGPHNRAYKRAVSIEFDKKDTEKAFEIQITDDESTQQPLFKIKPWK